MNIYLNKSTHTGTSFQQMSSYFSGKWALSTSYLIQPRSVCPMPKVTSHTIKIQRPWRIDLYGVCLAVLDVCWWNLIIHRVTKVPSNNKRIVSTPIPLTFHHHPDSQCYFACAATDFFQHLQELNCPRAACHIIISNCISWYSFPKLKTQLILNVLDFINDQLYGVWWLSGKFDSLRPEGRRLNPTLATT